MLPDVCSKHVLACMVKVYMSCVVSTPQTPVSSSSGPTSVPVRPEVAWFSVYDKDHGNLFWVGMAVK